MAKLSNHQILDLAYKVGWHDAGDLERVLATVLAESGGNTEVTSYTGCCHGLLQINVNSTSKTPAELKDAETNMREGFRLWSQRGWQPWNSSRAGQLLRGPEARVATATWHASPGVGAEGTPGAIAGAVPDVPGLSDALAIANRARAWIATPANIGRFAVGMIGAVIIVVGFAILAWPIAEPVVKALGAVK
jgi:hypothetical protein